MIGSKPASVVCQFVHIVSLPRKGIYGSQIPRLGTGAGLDRSDRRPCENGPYGSSSEPGRRRANPPWRTRSQVLSSQAQPIGLGVVLVLLVAEGLIAVMLDEVAVPVGHDLGRVQMVGAVVVEDRIVRRPYGSGVPSGPTTVGCCSLWTFGREARIPPGGVPCSDSRNRHAKNAPAAVTSPLGNSLAHPRA